MAAREELEEAASASPGPALHIWEWFLELHAARGSNGFGSNPIGWAEIYAWAQLTGRKPAVWEVSAIREIDQAYLEAQSRESSERKDARRSHG